MITKLLATAFLSVGCFVNECMSQQKVSDADSAQYWWGKGFVSAVKGNFEEAIVGYDKSIKLYSSKGEVYYDRGNARAQLKDYLGAIDDYTNALKYLIDDTDKWKTYYVRGRAKVEISDLQGAIMDFTDAIKLSPSDEEAYYHRATAKDKQKDYKGAIEDFSKIIELNPKSSRAYKLRGIEKIRLRDRDGGCADLSTAGELGDTKVGDVMSKLCNAPD